MGPQVDVSRFVDIEAQIQDDDDVESSDGDSIDDFIEDQVKDDVGHMPVRWEGLQRWKEDEGPEFLRDLALSIQSRHRASAHELYEASNNDSFLESKVISFSRLPTHNTSIFRVRVKPGSERDVVIAILQKTVHANTRHENILAAFSRDAIHGWVYIEARSTPSVSNILVGINGVAHYKNHQPPFFIDPIDYSDYPALLDMTLNGLPPHVTTWSWVRIKSGKYRHDLGIVTNVDDLSLESVVALLPRLHLSKKRKRRSRPPAIPFDGETIRGLFGEAAVETRGDTQIFKAELYRYGLHFAKFHITQLCSQGVNATEQELEPFRCIPEIWGFAKHTISALKIHDHIRVNGGPLAGFTGVILEIKALTASFRADDTTQVQEALLSEVRKLFALGDFVEVISGIHRGKQGFIVGLDGRSASIYCRRIGLIYSSFVELPGQEAIVDLHDLDWKSTPEALNNMRLPDPSVSLQLPTHYTANVYQIGEKMYTKPPERDKMFTGDRYRNMEVSIHKGDAKGHFGVIRGSHYTSKGDIIFDVQTSTRVVNTTNSYPGDHLRERHTGLPLDRACWIPLRHLQPIKKPASLLPNSSTPLYSINTQEVPEIDVADAWKVNSSTPQPLDSHNTVEEPPPGSWLLDSRLIHKKLDVRITGTTSPPWHGGRHEGHSAFLVLTKSPKDIDTSQTVKVGFEQSRMYFKMCHLSPEQTTERPGFVSKEASKPIVSSIGQRVVIIGLDTTGESNFIGYYGLIVACPFALDPGQACVQMASPGILWGKHGYFHETSLCRSHDDATGPVEWFGKYY